MIRLVTFDLDDTLWDVRPALRRAEAAQWDWLESHFPGRVSRNNTDLLSDIRRDLLSETPDLAHRISQFRQAFIHRLLAESGIPNAQAASAAAQAFEHFLSARQNVDIYPNAAATLKKLADRYVLAALTNGNADVFQTPLAPYFTFAFKAEEVGAGKPAPDLFIAATRQAHVTPQELVHVGDSIDHDIAGARNFGARAIWFNQSGQKHNSANVSVSCLSMLPAALLDLETTHST